MGTSLLYGHTLGVGLFVYFGSMYELILTNYFVTEQKGNARGGGVGVSFL